MTSRTDTEPRLWDDTADDSENLSALRWLFEHGLVDERRVREAVERRPSLRVSSDLSELLDAHPAYADHRVGEIVLGLLQRLDVPMRRRAEAVALAARDLLRPGSELATLAYGIESQYDPGEHDSELDADAAVAVRIENLVNAIELRPIRPDPQPIAHGVVGDRVRYGDRRWWVAWPVGIGAALYWWSVSGGIDDGSGWVPIFTFVSACLIAFASVWVLRFPGTTLTPSGIEFRTLFSTTRVPWSEVCDVDVDEEVHHHQGSWLFGPTTVRHVAVTVKPAGARRPTDRIRFATPGRSEQAVHDEVVAFARRHGSQLKEWPDHMHEGALGVVLATIGVVAILGFMTYGLGVCRGCEDDGWVVRKLSSKQSTSWVERQVGDTIREEHGDVWVACPDRAKPRAIFTCTVEGDDAPYDEVRVRFTNDDGTRITWWPKVE